jgi:drug/metabolite transporter (DMT)-like permease
MHSSDEPQRAHGRVPYIALGVTSFAWGIGPIFIRHSGVSGLSTSAWRMSLAVPVMMIIAKVAGTPVTWPIVKRMAPFGVMFGLNTVCGFTATKVTTIAIASLIGSMYPVIVLVVAGRYLGETINRRQVMLSIFAVCGVAVVVLAGTSSGHHSVVGDLWAFAALLIWVVYFVMT